MSSIVAWIHDRIPVSPGALRELTNEPVPNHLKKWWFALGGTPAYLFVVQIATGILLAVYYESSTSTAYESVRRITEDVSYGWYLRSLHKWGATLMIAAVILHQMRVYFTGAYRKPREINWMVGMTILICTLMLGFTGYSLVYEQLSYWGATVAANITGSIPVVGDFMRTMLLGADTYSRQTLPRFFVLHAAVLPVALIFLLVVHIGIIRLQGVTEFLPISSSAHLILTSYLLGWKDQGLPFDIALHLGSMLANRGRLCRRSQRLFDRRSCLPEMRNIRLRLDW